MEEPMRDASLEITVPNNPAAERTILGNILIDNALIAHAMEVLDEDEFYIPAHRKIFRAMIALFMTGQQITYVLIAQELMMAGELEQVGGTSFISGLMDGLPLVIDLEDYVEIVKGDAMLRQLYKESNRIARDVLAHEDPAKVILERAGKGIFEITLDNTVKTFSSISVIAHGNLQKAHQIEEMGTAITGVASGFSDLDALTLGWQKTDLILAAARPSMGKTAFAVQLADYAATDLGLNVALFSLEMSKEQIGNRVLCCRAGVDSQRFRSGYLNPDEWARLHQAEHDLAHSKLFIDDTPGISNIRIKAKCRRLIAEHGALHLIIVDYVQLMDNDGTRNHFSREQEVSGLSRGLKGTAKELEVPMLALSQLSRKPEDRTDHRPQLADLRDSGSLEQDADLVAFLYREDSYRKARGEHPSTFDHQAEIILAKQRNGPTGRAILRFEDTSGRFDNLYQDAQHHHG